VQSRVPSLRGPATPVWSAEHGLNGGTSSPETFGPVSDPAPLVHGSLPLAASGGRIALVVADGAGDLATAGTGWRTPLEAARTPNLDALCAHGDLGLLHPAHPGITLGSVSGHLALFGYDPLRTRLRRGAVDALGMGLPMRPGDVALRGNLATVDADGRITDRRAGRPTDEEGARALEAVTEATAHLEGVRVTIRHTKGHRFSLVLHGAGLDDRVTDTDPQQTGVPVRDAQALHPAAQRTAELLNRFTELAGSALRPLGGPANTVLLRGASSLPHLTPFPQGYRLRALALAAYPTYRGVAQACGMDVATPWPESIEETIERAAQALERGDYDFVFAHHKATDQAGEDGDFEAKVAAIERLDRALEPLLRKPPDVLVVTADHSTPVALRQHGWQPVPLLLVSRWTGARQQGARWTERDARGGALGVLRAVDLMPLVLAHAQRLQKIDGEGDGD